MYVDNNLVFSDAQAITSTGVSTKSYDAATALRNIGTGEPIELIIQVATAASSASASTVTFSLQDSSDNSSFTDVIVSPAVAMATMATGAEVLRIMLPHTLRRYIQVAYTVATGPLTGGNFTAFLAVDRQNNVARPSGITTGA